MAYFNTCPICGAHLDPGERCTCREAEERPQRKGQRDRAGKTGGSDPRKDAGKEKATA